MSMMSLPILFVSLGTLLHGDTPPAATSCSSKSVSVHTVSPERAS